MRHPILSTRPAAAFLCVVASLVLAGCGKEPTVEDRTQAEQFRETASAFSGPVSNDGGKHAAAINELFTKLGVALTNGDHDGVRKHMDVHMMVQLMDKQGMLPARFRKDRKKIGELLSQMLPAQLCSPLTGIAWTRYEIRKVRFVTAEDEAVVITRMWDEAGIGSKMRWWIYKDGDNWRAYDLEILEMSLRFSTMMAVGFSEAEKGTITQADLQGFLQAVQMVAMGQMEAAERTLKDASSLSLPPVLEALRMVMLSAIYADTHRYDEALAATDKAEANQSDMPMVHYLRAMSYNGKGQHDKALKVAALYLEQLGSDADILVEMGDANLGLGNSAKAVTAYRDALKDDAQSIHALLGLLRVDPAGAGNLLEDYRKVNDVEFLFPTMVDQLVLRKDAAALRRLIDLHKQVKPGDEAIKDAEDKLKAMQ